MVNAISGKIGGCRCKSLYCGETSFSDEEFSILIDYFNADQDNILTFLRDLKEKNFIDSYKFIDNIKF